MAGRPAVLLFDVFGTVVDWRGSVVDVGSALARRLRLDVDWGEFAAQWRTEGYLKPIEDVVMGRRGWTPVDEMLAEQLDVLIDRHGLSGLDETDRLGLLTVWRRLRPWPDAVNGLARLKSRFLIGPLSNGGFAMLAEMAKAGGLPWDFVISAEFFRAYKPSPDVYIGATRLLERSPDEVMLVAAHPADLDAAHAAGLRTAFVPRPLEWGPDATSSPAGHPGDSRFDLVARDFLDLADQLAR